MADTKVKGLPFAEAIAYLRDKIDLPTRTWTDLWQGMHARAFVVAGAVRAELIADFHNAIRRAIEEGRTLADFRKDFDAIVSRHGWSYNGGRGWRSRVIYDTNIRMAHASGRWAQIQRVATRRPYLRYVAVEDSRTRPEHTAWHGTVLPVGDPWWSTHYPPNGWYCRCTTQSLSERDLERYGYKPSQTAPPVKMTPRRINTPTGPVTVQVPDGIDPGFAYNPGEAGFGRGVQSLALERHGEWERLAVPGGSRPEAPPELAVEPFEGSLGRRARDLQGLRSALRSAIGGDEAVFADPTGERVLIGQALADHLATRLDGREIFLPTIPALIENPQEIWVGFAVSRVSGRVSLRRRYIRLLRIGRNRTVGLVADVDNGMWSGLTFHPAGAREARGFRWGLRVYDR